MASGYVTSDGKDLDARYLGINAKANSAVQADSATKVDASHLGITGKAPIKLNIFTMPADGYLGSLNIVISVNKGSSLTFSFLGSSYTISPSYSDKKDEMVRPFEKMFVHKGATITISKTGTASWETPSGELFPLVIRSV